MGRSDLNLDPWIKKYCTGKYNIELKPYYKVDPTLSKEQIELNTAAIILSSLTRLTRLKY